MKTNYVLIDYESVQPTDIDLLHGGPFKVRIFLGPHQAKKVGTALAMALQPFGRDAEYILLETSGPNALDFHIAYYVGVFSRDEPEAYFHIISKDGGFDPLIQHLRGKKLLVRRSECIADIPFFTATALTVSEAQIQQVIADLIRRKDSKPSTRKKLASTIQALFKEKLSEQQLENLFNSLSERGAIKLEGATVSYTLPEVPPAIELPRKAA
ncbi:PIN domain-containing protein [Oxalobacteraceae bacterium R-40]|uniref:PIN domain-containing protein n=1 Tax=Keguizhuia sedimenti TaxID=3064264 RepID=A0ABU1BKY6_9BURK|nr:PIN domain-containing protein [Oxalobacteraceae bacterium R-40]